MWKIALVRAQNDWFWNGRDVAHEGEIALVVFRRVKAHYDAGWRTGIWTDVVASNGTLHREVPLTVDGDGNVLNADVIWKR